MTDREPLPLTERMEIARQHTYTGRKNVPPGGSYYVPGLGEVFVGREVTGECAQNRCAECSGEPPEWAVAVGIATGPCEHECHEG